ncbi:MAG: lysophospholipid acyltransferase family protein [Acidobacteriota bacterium]
MSAGKRLRDFLLYLPCRCAFVLLACLPRRAGLAIGRCLGHLFYRASPGHRRIALDNLHRALGRDVDRRSRERIARAAFAHLGMICADAAYFPRLVRRATERVAVYEGVEYLREAQAEGRGVLLFSGHYGHWELVALLQHRLGVRMAMVVRPLNNPWFDGMLVRLRRLSGNTLLPKRNAARGVLRALRDGRVVAILIDQNVRGEAGIAVDFFGAPASTTPSLATFAFKSGAPIVPVFSYPLPDGRLRIRFEPPLRALRRGALQDDVQALTHRCTSILEREVRRRPEYWLWMHNRWRTAPSGVGSGPRRTDGAGRLDAARQGGGTIARAGAGWP